MHAGADDNKCALSREAPELAVIAVTRHTEDYLSRALLNPIIYRRLNALKGSKLLI